MQGQRPGNDGCSSVPDRPFGVSFTPCCNAHDCCYQTCGSSKKQCDDAFGECTAQACNNHPFPNADARQKCLAYSGAYRLGVGAFASSAFNERQSQVCICRASDAIQVDDPACPGFKKPWISKSYLDALKDASCSFIHFFPFFRDLERVFVFNGSVVNSERDNLGDFERDGCSTTTGS